MSREKRTRIRESRLAYAFIKIENAIMFRKPTRHAGFTLVEIMIVVAIIALLAAIAVPGFLRARKRSQASKILNDLRLIDGAVDQYSIETGRKTNDPVNIADWTNYLKKDTNLYRTGQDLFGDDYGQQTVDTLPTVPANAFSSLSDVAGTGFWSPYGP
jgi:prepilin-type N-terminal cleavage/methylation domain-containing protein